MLRTLHERSSILISVLIAILLLGILIAIHEFGHFMAARLMKIEVQEFAIGFGPKLIGWTSRKTGTKFALRAIPLGGFCAFYGEDDVDGSWKDDPRAYSRQNVWKRMFTVVMGPMMNFVLAFVVAAGFYWYTGIPEIEPYIVAVEASSPAQQAGIQANDVIVSVDGRNVLDGTVDTLVAALSGAEPLPMVILRDGEEITTTCTPFWDAEMNRHRIGVTIGAQYTGESTPMTLLQACGESWYTCVHAGGVILDALGGLVTRGEGLDQTSGPVGVVAEVSRQVSEDGLIAFLNLLVVISINLGIMNLLPIPGLDGSRILFMLIEAVRRKPISREKEAMVHLAGMAFLFAVMIFFTFRDVMNLFR